MVIAGILLRYTRTCKLKSSLLWVTLGELISICSLHLADCFYERILKPYE